MLSQIGWVSPSGVIELEPHLMEHFEIQRDLLLWRSVVLNIW